ncbi:peptidase C39 family protein [Streptomyces sp. JJ36]|uniref:peptidase C39 family protein n=1 Tax=Streptomyces sp. JJ36 TaxID=2736645 RepID=UPI001F305913|nr:peptidase C39 family protein [Streptomyces sp. JJ36]MCF6524608.1 peptidase C39 family protein [Streptomyces sp. JJ36]
MTSRSAKRRSVLAAAAAVAAVTAAPSAVAHAAGPAGRRRPHRPEDGDLIDFHGWSSYRDWRNGEHAGTRVAYGRCPGLAFAEPAGTTEYHDPHTGRTAEWEYATWTSAPHTPAVPAAELVASWNAVTPEGTWLRVEMRGEYSDGCRTPWYTLGVWTAGDGEDVPRRTSVPGQGDGRSSIWTDTFAVGDTGSGLRLAAYRLRLTLCRAPGSRSVPVVRRLGAMLSDLPARFEVPAAEPGCARGIELDVPRYSQNVHEGRYPEFDGGGEAWCSPTSSQMIIEYWGHRPTPEDLAWVKPEYDDPQVCHAARMTFDYAYEGCGNWPFNAAYAATYHGLESVVTRCASLDDAERLVAAGIPLITSQSFTEDELDGAGYGTAGHLMTVIGFTEDGDVIANDPASEDNAAVRRVYPRRQFENIWLRTRRYNAEGEVRSGTGGVCYLYFPEHPSGAQRRVLRELGIR